MVQLMRSSFRIRSEFYRFLLSFNVIVYVDIMLNQKSIPLQQKKMGIKIRKNMAKLIVIEKIGPNECSVK